MAIRDVVDDLGRAWTIYPVVPDSYDDRIGMAPGYQRGWLCFQSGAEKWRYLGIPAQWDRFDELALLELMDEAILVRGSAGWSSTP